ncbi:MAG: NDMA-dependent alcohol dehydrogenase [Dermatophilaceae bacterium]
MKTKAAVVHEIGKPMEIEELELTDPRHGEVLVRYTHAGLCHTDWHIPLGDFEARLPIVPGHEGGGIVKATGPGVDRVAVGDHVVCMFIPACGVCRWCAQGMQSICDTGANVLQGALLDGRFPLTGRRGDYGALSYLGTFSQFGVVPQCSIVRVDEDLPLDKACLVGCGVPTGWGAVVSTAKVKPGETVVVFGVGGIGSNAVQGARHAGARHIVAVDPVAFKREVAMRLGATHTAASGEEALALVMDLTRGVGADAAILCPGLTTEEIAAEGFQVISKGGVMVVVGLNKFTLKSVQASAAELALWRKTIKGSLFGDCNPTADIPRLLELYRAGELKVDELVTRTYTLEQVNEGYADMVAGRNIRGVIVHDH